MPISTVHRHEITALLADGLSNQEIASQVGVSIGQVAAVKAHITMGTYGGGGDGEPETETEIANAVDASFGLERDLQLALRRNIEQLEAGLSIIDGDREQTVPSGRIDITARDERGITVLIELKAASADRDAVGQILSYVGDVLDREPEVRGIIDYCTGRRRRTGRTEHSVGSVWLPVHLRDRRVNFTERNLTVYVVE